MSSDIRMVVFDMAGTTVDEQNVVYKTVHKAICNQGVSVDLATVFEFGAGKEKLQAIKDVLEHLKVEDIDALMVFEEFKTMLDDAYEKLEVRPVEGVEKTMLELKRKGIVVVLNTGYNRRVATGLLKKLGWVNGVNYDMLITASDVVLGRPHPEMIEKAMAKFNINDAKQVLKAGDSGIDIEEGKNAHCGITVGVLSGAQSKEQLEAANPDYIIGSLATLVEDVLS